ncbi:MAG: biotin--[Paludibacteraceae bacterium]|nr:biotin--[acetyl-CoA-carboxylase] ligase [Paludibacteraceae bacterium]
MYIERTDSTNTLMKEMIAKGEWQAGEEYLYTGFQTAGRGQSGNGWESEEGKNLLCSILISRQPSAVRSQPFYLNVAVSVAVHEVIRSVLCQQSGLYSVSEAVSIKWPNDIYYGDKKIAGILIENALFGSELKYAVAGIGLNVNQTEWLSNAPNPVSMRQISGEEYHIHELMRTLMDEIHTVLAMESEEVWSYYRAHIYRKDGFWPFVEREVSIAPTTNYSPSLEERDGERLERPIFLAKIENVRTDGELELRDQDGNLRTYHFKQVRYVI